MAMQPDHLIERAAALLKGGAPPRLRDAASDPPANGAAAVPLAGPGPTGGIASLLVPEPSKAPILLPGPPPGGQLPGLGPSLTAVPMPAAPVSDARGAPDEANGGPQANAPQANARTAAVPAAPPRPAPLRPPQASVRSDAASMLPVISIEALESAGMVVARAARTRISEEYRIVIGRVLRALRDEPDGAGAHNVVMVTSARPGEGKSFTALNLAGSIAQHSTEKVLLIDVDAKLRPVSSAMGVGDRLGFHDLVLDATLRPEDVILNTAVGNLSFLPVGTRSGSVTDTAGVRPITPTLTRLARRFPKHLIMVDAPPCLSTSDPHTIAPFVGQVVLVIEAERTQRSEVEAALELVRVCPTITMLLNKVKLTTSHTFGAYDYYGSYT